MSKTDTSTMPKLKAPFPWFGGKSQVAPLVWQALGDVKNYVEPFFGSGAVLLGRPHLPHVEIVNDRDGFVCNFWRALQAEPDAVAYYADQPVMECDLHARHSWLVRQADRLVARLEGDPAYYDPIIAGYWVWGVSCWIGGEFCSGKGPWHAVDGELVKMETQKRHGTSPQRQDLQDKGILRKRVHLANSGMGVSRRLVELNARETQGERVQLGQASSGIIRQRLHITNRGQGVQRTGLGEAGLTQWMQALAERLRHVRVCCGDWTRVMGPAATQQQRVNGIFLDPPYARSERAKDLYRVEADISGAVRQWAIDNGDNPKLRIVLAGYVGEHEMPKTWRAIAWKANGGYANFAKSTRGRNNAKRERLWLSPHCLEVTT